MYGFAFYTGMLCNDLYLFLGCYTNFFQSNRKTYFPAEILNFFKLCLWSAL